MSAKDFTGDITYPSILFRLKNDYYAVNCGHVASIMQIPEIEPLPDAPNNVLGIFRFREKVIPIVCLRRLFGIPSTDDEIRDMEEMLDARKQDHVEWVQELNRCTKSGQLFALARDPHQCALGRWYDQYEPENSTIKMQLKKMEEPHRKLHEAADELELCNHQDDREHCQNEILNKVTKEYMPQVLSVLEGTKDIFREHRRTLLIVVDNGENPFAMAVDEVLSVEELLEVASTEEVERLKGSAYITEIRKSSRLNRLVRMIQDDKLAAMARNYHLE